MAKDKFVIGDKITSKRYGEGVVKNIDPNNYEFHYDVKFKDGTGAWISGRDSKKI